MRSLSLSALIAVAAFALGLMAAGRVPGDAAAAEKPAGFDWKSDGKSLVLTNSAPDVSFLAIGKLRSGSSAVPVPAHSAGQVKIPIQDVNSLAVYRIEAALLCDRNGCRPCHPNPTAISAADCPIPPPIPIGRDRYQVSIDPRGALRP